MIVPDRGRKYLRWTDRHDQAAMVIISQFQLQLPRDRELVRQLAFVRVQQGYDDPWRLKYERHLRSPYWASLRQQVLHLCGGRCQRCNRKTTPLQLHHRTYDNLGHEHVFDVEMLCDQCHPVADQERSAQERYYRGLNTFAQHLAEQGDHRSLDEIAEDFDAWLETKTD